HLQLRERLLRARWVFISEARAEKDIEGWGMAHHVPADIVWFLLSWPDDEIAARRFAAGNRDLPAVADPALDALGRDDHDQRAGREIGEAEIVRGRRVRRQDAAACLVRQDGDDLAIPGAEPVDAALPCGERDGRQCPEIRLTGALKVALVIELLHRRVGGKAVGEIVRELERADARLDRLWCLLDGCHGTSPQSPFIASP